MSAQSNVATTERRLRAFVITGIQRTGSSAVARALAQQESVACGWEWPQQVSWRNRISSCQRGLNGDFGRLAPRHREQIAELISATTQWLGYRHLFRANDKWALSPALAPTLALDRFHRALAWWRGQPQIHIIHIFRADNLAWLRSKYMARESGSFWAGQAYPEISVTIPIRQAVKRLRMKLWVDAKLHDLRRTNPYHMVRHEDLLKDRDGTVRRLHEFLGLEPRLLAVNQAGELQSAGTSAKKHIANYDVLYRALEREKLLSATLSSI